MKGMAGMEPQYTGEQWQQRINSLLRTHCRLQGEVYQEIPDQTHGDGGLEGIGTGGDAYQCYADEQTLSPAALMKKQKEKIKDIWKLEEKKEFWKDFLQGSKIKRWFLVVPSLANKEVVAHARREATKLRKKKLSILDPAFQAFVVTEDYFAEARKQLEEAGALCIDVRPDTVEAKDLSDFVTTKAKFIENTDAKLAQVYGEKQAASERAKYLTFHLQSSNIVQKLFKRVPELWERLQGFLAQEETTVSMESDLDESKASIRLMTVRRKLSEDLSANFKPLSKSTVDRIAWGTVASWIGECPLRFREINGGA
jgi:hypothetical protein